ncbi:MAG: hypothetical protein OSA99_07205 [Acidimicrobiales bacterium]|nr:hypothetical protein [Acidimicrobiales bacterium]
MTGRRAVFPGSFDPLTIAHLGIVDAVHDQFDVDTVHLALSYEALAKEGKAAMPVHDRAEAARSLRGRRPWLAVVTTEAQLLVDIAEGYDLLVVGADKWHQLHDPQFYGDSIARRDDAIGRLPELVVVPRAEIELPSTHVQQLLDVPESIRHVSSSGVRAGRSDWRAD